MSNSMRVTLAVIASAMATMYTWYLATELLEIGLKASLWLLFLGAVMRHLGGER